VAAIADEFVQHAGDQGEGLGPVEAHAAREPSLGEEAQVGDCELVELVRGGKRSVIERRRRRSRRRLLGSWDVVFFFDT
jgi:hypothetical protein